MWCKCECKKYKDCPRNIHFKVKIVYPQRNKAVMVSKRYWEKVPIRPPDGAGLDAVCVSPCLPPWASWSHPLSYWQVGCGWKWKSHDLREYCLHVFMNKMNAAQGVGLGCGACLSASSSPKCTSSICDWFLGMYPCVDSGTGAWQGDAQFQSQPLS